MASRLELQTLLEAITGHVYFQPPTSIQMQYPCIRYAIDGDRSERADNRLYKHTKRYQVTVIDRNPDSELPDQVVALPLCSFDRYFAADNLNHYVYTLFF
jgi:hypothetical protein